MFTQDYKCLTKRNSYTISYCISNNIHFGLMQKFIVIEGHRLAVIKKLHIKMDGPLHSFNKRI